VGGSLLRTFPAGVAAGQTQSPPPPPPPFACLQYSHQIQLWSGPPTKGHFMARGVSQKKVPGRGTSAQPAVRIGGYCKGAGYIPNGSDGSAKDFPRLLRPIEGLIEPKKNMGHGSQQNAWNLKFRPTNGDAPQAGQHAKSRHQTESSTLQQGLKSLGHLVGEPKRGVHELALVVPAVQPHALRVQQLEGRRQPPRGGGRRGGGGGPSGTGRT